MTEERTNDAAIPSFIARLARLDAGGLAVLRRSAGQTLAESPRSYSVFFAALPQGITRPKQQERFFLVATLYALTTRGSDERRTSGGLSLGMALRALRQDQLAATGRGQDDKISLDRRLAALINADAAQLPFRLRQIVRLAHSRDQALDWHTLLRALLNWEHPDHVVQQRWMREYYIGTSVEPLNTFRTTQEAHP